MATTTSIKPTSKRDYRDGVFSALGGVDSGKIPSILQPNQLAWAINATVRGGAIDQRPAFDEQTLTFTDIEQQAWFQAGRLIGGGTYRDGQGVRHLVACVSGRVFLINPADSYTVQEITPTTQTTLDGAYNPPAIGASNTMTVHNASSVWVDYPIWIGTYVYTVTAVAGNVLTVTNVNDPTAAYADDTIVNACDPNNPNRTQAWVCQAENWLIIQDNQAAAILYNGTVSRRTSNADSAKLEMPCGSAMVYCRGRIWVAVGDYQIAAGDIVGGVTDVINFTEETYLAEGGRFRCDQPIRAMATTATMDTSLGQGPVLVFAHDAIYSINVPADRTVWKKQTYPIVTTVLASGGTDAHYSVVQVNQDLFYRAPDGWRSLTLARRENNSWGNVAMSSELERVIRSDTETLLPYASAMLWNNYLFVTMSPRMSTVNPYHAALGVMDFDPISSMAAKQAPVWMGMWTGILPILMFSNEFMGETRAFIWATSTAGVLKLYEIRDDMIMDDGTVRISSAIETRSMDFKDPLHFKTLAALELWIANLKGTVDFTLKWKPDQAECWYTWNTKQVCATYRDCDQTETTCKTIANYKPGYRSRLGFGPAPNSSCEPQDLKPANIGYEFQIRLEWIGKCALRKVLVKCEEADELQYALCD